MNRKHRPVIAGVLGMAVTVASNAAPVVIDTQQKAAAAALTAHSFFLADQPSNTLPVMLIQLNYPSLDLVDDTLRILANATTPDALTATRGGM